MVQDSTYSSLEIELAYSKVSGEIYVHLFYSETEYGCESIKISSEL